MLKQNRIPEQLVTVCVSMKSWNPSVLSKLLPFPAFPFLQHTGSQTLGELYTLLAAYLPTGMAVRMKEQDRGVKQTCNKKHSCPSGAKALRFSHTNVMISASQVPFRNAEAPSEPRQNVVDNFCRFTWRWLVLMTCLWNFRKAHIWSQKCVKVVRARVFSGSKTTGLSVLRRSPHFPVTDLRLSRVETV